MTSGATINQHFLIAREVKVKVSFTYNGEVITLFE